MCKDVFGANCTDSGSEYMERNVFATKLAAFVRKNASDDDGRRTVHSKVNTGSGIRSP